MKAYLDPEEIAKLEETTEYLRDKLLVRLLFRLGSRVSEVLGLRVEDIDFRQGNVTIQHLKTRVQLSCPQCGAKLAKQHKFCPTCGDNVSQALSQSKEQRRYRKLPVDQVTLSLLKEYMDRGGIVSKDGQKLIFSLRRHRAWQIVRDLATKAGLPRLVITESGIVHNVSPHRLRDAFAVNAIKHNDSGDGLRLLQEHLGHQSITTTMKYRKVSGKEQKEWFEKLWQGDQENGQVQKP
jgi:integrase/recombinase XerD